jgi:hypothetical protein
MMEVHIPVPAALKGGGLFALYRPGGLGPLLSRLSRHEQFGDEVPEPLTAPEIARLVEAFADEPLPAALRGLVVRHLEGKVKRLRGRKPTKLTTRELIHQEVLPFIYEEALEAEKVRDRELKAKAKAMRRGTTKLTGTPAERAVERVKKLMPGYRHLSTRALQNLIAARRKQQAKLEASE